MVEAPQTTTSILLEDGRFFDFSSPEEHGYNISSIAHALSNICRYTGHSDWFYSVAEHSVLVSHLVPEGFELIGLLHDASEAYCGDVSSPLKAMIPEYRKIEKRVQSSLFSYFDLGYTEVPEEVHLADKQLYKAERQQIATAGRDLLWHADVEAADVEILGLKPDEAYQLFLDRYKSLVDVIDEDKRKAA